MERDLSKLHKGTDGFYYDDYVQPDKPEVFIGRLVSPCGGTKGSATP